MKRDDRQPAVGGKPCRNSLESDPKALELLVDGDAERLKRSRGGVDTGRRVLSWDRRGHNPREVTGGSDRLLPSDVCNPPSDSPGKPLFAKFFDQVSECLGPHAADHPPGRFAFGGVKPKIERSVGIKREAAGVVGELIARETDIEEHTIDLVDGERVEHLGDVPKIGLGESDRFSSKLLGPTGDGERIAIDRDDEAVGAYGVGEESGVPAAPECAIDHPHPRLDVEMGQHFGSEDGRVDTGGGVHALTVAAFVRTIRSMADADLYDYDLPRELIAQTPLGNRADARLLVVRRADGSLAHRHIRDLPELLEPGDLVVVNDTRVVPARLVGRRGATGGAWEGLFLQVEREGEHAGAWRLLAQTRGRPELGERIVLVDREGHDAAEVTLVGRATGGAWIARAHGDERAEAVLARVGRVPLPGYIRGGADEPGDVERYQTVFARASGSAAAPTAGLHFTEELLAAIAARGIARASVTLHVGLDTFRPITSERLDDHPMHTEWCECPPDTAAAVNEARARGGRVVAIGTTAVRTLETAARGAPPGAAITACTGPTDLFIRPGHRFRAVDCVLTNFHMPRTTLMVLVSTFASRDLIARAYAEAIRERYRFLSYGDAMLLL